MYVQYIGNKTVKVDNVNKDGKGRRWEGYGATLVVPDVDGHKLIAYKDIWRPVDSADAPAPPKPAATPQERAVVAQAAVNLLDIVKVCGYYAARGEPCPKADRVSRDVGRAVSDSDVAAGFTVAAEIVDGVRDYLDSKHADAVADYEKQIDALKRDVDAAKQELRDAAKADAAAPAETDKGGKKGKG